MDFGKIREQLIDHEGLRLKPYKCSAGKLTIGVGRNLDDVGISESEAMDLFYNDVCASLVDLRALFKDFDSYPENIKLVLVDMRFQLGMKGFKTFKKMIAAVKNHHWPDMILQMKDSDWYHQTTNRANNLIRMVEAEVCDVRDRL